MRAAEAIEICVCGSVSDVLNIVILKNPELEMARDFLEQEIMSDFKFSDSGLELFCQIS